MSIIITDKSNFIMPSPNKPQILKGRTGLPIQKKLIKVKQKHKKDKKIAKQINKYF